MIVPRTSLQANFINFILFYVFSVGTSYSQFHVIYYRNSKVPVPHELEDRYPHIWDTGMFCRVISSEMRDNEYVPWTGKNYSCNDSILSYGEVKLILWWRWYERIIVTRRPCQYFDFVHLWKSFWAEEFQTAWWTLTVAAVKSVWMITVWKRSPGKVNCFIIKYFMKLNIFHDVYEMKL